MPPAKTFDTYGPKSITLKIYNNCRSQEFTKNFTLVAPSQARTIETEDSKIGTEVNVYPNPSESGIFNLILPANMTNARFQLIDSKGKMILQDKLVNEGINTLDISGYNKGMYWIVISSDNQKTVTKVLSIQ